jgi:hypothetical protein
VAAVGLNAICGTAAAGVAVVGPDAICGTAAAASFHAMPEVSLIMLVNLCLLMDGSGFANKDGLMADWLSIF